MLNVTESPLTATSISFAVPLIVSVSPLSIDEVADPSLIVHAVLNAV